MKVTVCVSDNHGTIAGRVLGKREFSRNFSLTIRESKVVKGAETNIIHISCKKRNKELVNQLKEINSGDFVEVETKVLSYEKEILEDPEKTAAARYRRTQPVQYLDAVSVKKAENDAFMKEYGIKATDVDVTKNEFYIAGQVNSIFKDKTERGVIIIIGVQHGLRYLNLKLFCVPNNVDEFIAKYPVGSGICTVCQATGRTLELNGKRTLDIGLLVRAHHSAVDVVNAQNQIQAQEENAEVAVDESELLEVSAEVASEESELLEVSAELLDLSADGLLLDTSASI